MKFSSFTNARPIDQTPYEIVERKGIGHPDTLVDGVAEALSIEYAKFCLEKFGVILHHNLDKTAVMGGLVDIDFGRGEMIKPAKLIFNGRMSVKFGDEDIDIKSFQAKVAKEYIKKVLPHIDVDNWMEFHHFTNSYSHNPYWYYPRSVEDLPDHKRPYANDTSTCAAYWPLSVLERLTLILEGYFYDANGLPKYNYVGQDIKVMAVRKENHITVTMCVPLISRQTPSAEFYTESLDRFTEELTEIAYKNIPKGFTVEVIINSERLFSKSSYYTLLTGSCIEAGEEGVVGRGNRSRGTISSTRPYSMEASNGKNPVYFVGKVHTVIADTLAEEIGKTFDCEANVFISTKFKEDLYNPSTLIIDTSRKIEDKKLNEVVEEVFSRRDWTDRIINEKLLLPKPGNLYVK